MNSNKNSNNEKFESSQRLKIPSSIISKCKIATVAAVGSLLIGIQIGKGCSEKDPVVQIQRHIDQIDKISKKLENKEIDNLLSKRAILEEQLKETDCKLKQFKAPNERVDKYLSEFLERKNKKVDTNQ